MASRRLRKIIVSEELFMQMLKGEFPKGAFITNLPKDARFVRQGVSDQGIAIIVSSEGFDEIPVNGQIPVFDIIAERIDA